MFAVVLSSPPLTQTVFRLQQSWVQIEQVNAERQLNKGVAIPENRGFQKNGNSVFSTKNNTMLTSFGKKLVTLKVTTKMSKLVDNACL